MKYRKFNKYEKKAIQHQHLVDSLKGSGKYIYQNSSRVASVKLPKATASGLREVGPGAQFQGDDYYMQLVKLGELRLIEVLQTPEQEKAVMEQEKLLVEQPATVTAAGTVEQVVTPKASPRAKPLRETQSAPATEAPVLLNEGPAEDGFIIVG
jgi:hypothetical protein